MSLFRLDVLQDVHYVHWLILNTATIVMMGLYLMMVFVILVMVTVQDVHLMQDQPAYHVLKMHTWMMEYVINVHNHRIAWPVQELIELNANHANMDSREVMAYVRVIVVIIVYYAHRLLIQLYAPTVDQDLLLTLMEDVYHVSLIVWSVHQLK